MAILEWLNEARNSALPRMLHSGEDGGEQGFNPAEYRTQFCNIRVGIPLYNSAHFFPNSSAIFSAIIIVGALVFPLGMVGMIEASTTRKFSISWTRKCSSTTAIVSLPILHVPMG